MQGLEGLGREEGGVQEDLLAREEDSVMPERGGDRTRELAKMLQNGLFCHTQRYISPGKSLDPERAALGASSSDTGTTRVGRLLDRWKTGVDMLFQRIILNAACQRSRAVSGSVDYDKSIMASTYTTHVQQEHGGWNRCSAEGEETGIYAQRRRKQVTSQRRRKQITSQEATIFG